MFAYDTPLRTRPKELLKDVDWHATKETIFASVGDDKKLMVYVFYPS